MSIQNSVWDAEKYLYRLNAKKNNIDNYYNKELRNISEGSKVMNLISLCKLFETNEERNRKRGGKGIYSKPIENTDVNKLTKRDINEFLRCKWFNKLTNHTKNQHLIRIKKYLRFSKREDLVEEIGDLLFKKEKRTLSKNDLISKEDLELILEHSNLKIRTLLMVLYEGALRIDEASNIRFKHIKFNGGYAILHIEKSKTRQRDIPLTESVPYLKEYFDNYDFEPEDKIFPYKRNTTINGILYGIQQKLTKLNPKWKYRKLNPHIFRHSRLTELAAGKFNEAQIRKFAGWTASSTMADIYFHLDDQDIINILTENEIKKPKPKKFEAIVCSICNTENNPQNKFCWKCNNLMDESKRNETVLQLFNQPEKIQKLQEDFDDLKRITRITLSILKHNVKLEEKSGDKITDEYKSAIEMLDTMSKDLTKKN